MAPKKIDMVTTWTDDHRHTSDDGSVSTTPRFDRWIGSEKRDGEMGETSTKNKDIDILLGNPKKALMTFMVPALLAFIVQNTDAIVDTMWVSGVGPAALAVIGYVTPINIVFGGIGMGVGIGASVIVSKAIGEGDRDRANKILGQSIILCLMISLVLMILLAFFGETFISFMSKGNYVEETMSYLIPMTLLAPFQLIALALSALLRSEGGFKKVMFAMIIAAIVNAVVDPILIYGANMGVGGAAWATGLSKLAATVLMLYFLLASKTYVKMDFDRFRINWRIMLDIFRVGIPASLGNVVIAVITIVINVIVTGIDPEHGVAVYGTIMKMFQFIVIPCLALGSAVTPICASALGQKKIEKVSATYKNAIVLGLIMMTLVSIFIFIAAEQVMIIFTYTDDSMILRDELATAIRIMFLAIAIYPIETITTYLFQSLGRGVRGLLSTLIKYVTTIILILIVTSYHNTMDAFWISYCIGSLIGQIIVFLWGVGAIRTLTRKWNLKESQTPA